MHDLTGLIFCFPVNILDCLVVKFFFGKLDINLPDKREKVYFTICIINTAVMNKRVLLLSRISQLATSSKHNEDK